MGACVDAIMASLRWDTVVIKASACNDTIMATTGYDEYDTTTDVDDTTDED